MPTEYMAEDRPLILAAADKEDLPSHHCLRSDVKLKGQGTLQPGEGGAVWACFLTFIIRLQLLLLPLSLFALHAVGFYALQKYYLLQVHADQIGLCVQFTQ